MVSPREVLDIVELIFYAPVLVVAGFVCLKHGFSRSAGYVALVTLSLLRLISASTGIASVHDPNNVNLITCSIICSAVGLSPLIATLLAFTRRIHTNSSPESVVPAIVIKIAGIPIVVGLIMGIMGGTDLTSSTPSDASNGHTYEKVSAMMYLLALIIVALIVLVTFATRSRMLDTDSKLLYAGIFAVPFIFVRILYSILLAFEYKHSNDFSLIADTKRAVAIQGCLGLLMEFIVVVVYLIAALLTPRQEPVPQGAYGADDEFKYGQNQQQYARRENYA